MKSARQLTDKINNLSKANGVNPQILLKTYLMECFLERISVSRYNNNFVVKGGVLIASLVGVASRSTMDIDLTAKRLRVEEEVLLKIINDIAKIELDDGVKFEIVKSENIREESEYNCFRITIKAFMDQIRDSFKLDITAGDVITPKEELYNYITLFDNRTINIQAYNIETILAEKIESILDKSLLNTRMRDFYDCYILHRNLFHKLDFEKFSKALIATATKRNSEKNFSEINNIIDSIKQSNFLQQQWEAYTKRNPYAKGIDFNHTINALNSMLDLLN